MYSVKTISENNSGWHLDDSCDKKIKRFSIILKNSPKITIRHDSRFCGREHFIRICNVFLTNTLYGGAPFQGPEAPQTASLKIEVADASCSDNLGYSNWATSSSESYDSGLVSIYETRPIPSFFSLLPNSKELSIEVHSDRRAHLVFETFCSFSVFYD